jgi:hypothetical protein
MKPIREYLSGLPAPYNKLALSVVDEKYKDFKAEANSLVNALNYMCSWHKTPQGHDFWYKVQLWCFDPNKHQLPSIPAVEVSPEVEQPNKLNELFTIIEQVRKGLIDLEQENAQLENLLKVSKDLNNDYKDSIADLESQLLSNPKELVYDAEWLDKVVKKYNEGYVLNDTCICVYHPLNRLSPKDSAPIIMAALAKELNSDWVADWEDNEQKKWRIENGYTARGYVVRASVFSFQNYRGITVFKDEQTALQAIDILTQIDPQILKNYFA